MKKLFLILAVILCAVQGLSAATKTFKLTSPFNAIETRGNVEVRYTKSGQMLAVATTDDDFMRYVTVKIENHKLIINYQSEGHKNSPKAVVDVSGGELDSFCAIGNSLLSMESEVATINLSASSAGNATLVFKESVGAKSLEANSVGNSTLKFERIAEISNAEVRSKGNSTLIFKKIKTAKLTAQSEGNSMLKISGVASSAQLCSTGNSTLSAGDLAVGAGSAQAQGNSTLKCDIKNPGKIQKSGNATLKNM